MKLIYGIEDKPKFSKTLVFAFQQMIAIMAATLLVPLLVTSYGLQADAAAALFGAGIGTIVYLFCTKRRSPVFLGSSFTFLGAYAATIGQNYGYWGMLIGVAFAGLVYVIIGLVIKVVGSGWVNKLMPSSSGRSSRSSVCPFPARQQAGSWATALQLSYTARPTTGLPSSAASSPSS